jgi:Na+/proline symporter
MWRALAPYLAAALLIMGGAGVAYSRGAPAWIAYAALLLATAVLLPGVARWEERQHHR